MAALTGYQPTYKERFPFVRARDVENIRKKQKDKVPIIIERYEGEKNLPLIDKTKFLVPDHITHLEFMQIIRRRLNLHPEQAIFALINEKSMVSQSLSMGEIYELEKDADGFLYVVYTSQPAFG